MKRRNFIWLSLIFTGSCGVPIATAPGSGDRDTLQKPEVVRFAVTDVQGLALLERDYGTFRDVLEEILDVEVVFFPVESYTDAASALQSGQVDLVLAGPSEYVVIRARTNAYPVVALTRPNFRTVIATRADSGIRSVADLKGKTIAVSNIGSTGSHLGTTKLILDAGLDPTADVKFFILDDPTNGMQSLEALIARDADAWGIFIHRYQEYLKERGLSRKDFPVLVVGDLLPNDIFIASSRLDPAFVADIRDRMVENQARLVESIVAGEPKFKGGKFVPSDDASYDTIREVYKALDQDKLIR